MAFPLGVEGLYRLVQSYTYEGQTCQNGYWYQFTSGFSHSAAQLSAAFAADILPLLTVLRHTSITTDVLDVKNMGDGSDYFTFMYATGAGVNAGTSQSKFDAWSITLASANWLVGKGGKRYAGLTESMLDGGGVANSTVEADLDALAIALADPLINGGTTYMPVIVSPANTRHSGNLIEPIVAALAHYPKSTQNSRK